MMMNAPEYTDAVLRAYLLGTLDDADQERFEERLFADDALAERLEVVESEVVDEVARGDLVAPRFAASRSDRIAFARDLADRADASAHRVHRRRWYSVAAAAVIVVAAAAVLHRPAGPPSLVLDPHVTRSTADTAVLAVGGARTVQLILQVPSEVAGERFAVVVTGPTTRWEAWDLEPDPEGRLVLVLLAENLGRGLHQVEISTGAGELVGHREFVIE
jgi:anti-sigma-K factor RskA